MSTNLDDRIDELERKFQALQAELREVRALAQAPAVAAAHVVPTPTGDARAALRALAKHVRIAVRDADAASLRGYAAEAEKSGRIGNRHAQRVFVGSFSGRPVISATPKIACQTEA